MDPRAEAERSVNDKVHDTESSTGVSHGSGDTKYRPIMQEAVPRGVENALPEKSV